MEEILKNTNNKLDYIAGMLKTQFIPSMANKYNFHFMQAFLAGATGLIGSAVLPGKSVGMLEGVSYFLSDSNPDINIDIVLKINGRIIEDDGSNRITNCRKNSQNYNDVIKIGRPLKPNEIVTLEITANTHGSAVVAYGRIIMYSELETSQRLNTIESEQTRKIMLHGNPYEYDPDIRRQYAQ